MRLRSYRNSADKLGFSDTATALAFASSLPIALPCLDTLHILLEPTIDRVSALDIGSMTFVWTMLIAVMFTALSLLFVCLLKTSYHRLGATIVNAGGVAYLLGYAVLTAVAFTSDIPPTILIAAGLFLGFGATILAANWLSRVRFLDFHSSFSALIVALLALAIANAVVLFLPPAMGSSLLFALACVGTLGGVRGNRRHDHQSHQPAERESNWWDVFGSFDLSLLEGTGDFKPLGSRILFFVATPLIMLLLFIVNRTMSPDASEPFSPLLIGCLLVVPCSLPLLSVKSDPELINISYRLYLPLLAFLTFAVNSLVSDTTLGIVTSVGIDAFCTLYFMLISGMVLAMAGRMRSLSLPVSSILLIGLGLIALLSYTRVDAGALIAYQRHMLMALFVMAVAALLATPGSRMWRMILEGVDRSERNTEGPSFAERCETVAQEYGLTEREAEILGYLGRGHSAAYVAEMLVIAESTARSHRKNIYRKLGINSREELLELLDSRSESTVEHPSENPATSREAGGSVD